jgi:two-component system sensor histidine kinase RegB
MRLLNIVTPRFLKATVQNLNPAEQKLLWLVRLRFVALFSQLPLTIIGRYYGFLTQASHIVFTIFLIALLAYNANLYRRITYKEIINVSDFYLTLQVTFDLIAFTALLSISGSSNNPFYAFFYVMAILGGIFSGGKSSYIFFFVLLFCVTLIQIQPIFFSPAAFDTVFLPQTFPYLLSQLFIPSVAFFIARSFGELFNEGQKRLIAFTVHSERLDRLRALGSLSAGFSHEFATPLQNAKLRLNRFLSSSTLDKNELHECRVSIQDCEDVLRRMNFSQLNFLEQDFETVTLQDIAEDTISTWKETSPMYKIKLISQPGEVRINKINFVQSFFNLLDNAAEVTKQSDEITIKIVKDDNVMRLIISDKGPGFSNEVLERIGEPFNTTKEKGTGLGLYSTQLFMNSIGGALHIRNEIDQGSSVELTFPKADL